ncbi:hypothetical protein ACRQ5D_24635 [Mucilaginibacter sp. P25]|uniref:Uncharacterized protein n=1 Tax=Mucilaginibacter gossypii TaxID=551996 RepID=A0A1G7TS88_9SPHI|nr:hypothetical protein SAMN05192573_103250 [Mucilaginibacter gossypii]
MLLERSNLEIGEYNYVVSRPDFDEYVNGILIIESKTLGAYFISPLYANGCPIVVFQTALGKRYPNCLFRAPTYHPKLIWCKYL